MSTRQVLGAVGAAIGGYFFGSIGAQWGWAIGSTIGGAIDPEIIRGPSIGDVAEQTSMEGGPRPIIFAMSPPFAGNIIVSGPPRTVRRRQSQGKGGPKVETESLYRTYAIGVCEGEIGGFVRVWRNGTLVYDVSVAPLIDTETNLKFLQNARFFTGSFEQLPSPDLETILGVGTTPAHRGTAYMVMADEDLTDLRGAIPQYTFQVQRCPVAAPAIVAVSDGATNGMQVMRSVNGIDWDVVATPLRPTSLPGWSWSGVTHSPSLGLFVAVNSDATLTAVMTSADSMEWTLQSTPSGGWLGVAWSEELQLLVAVRNHADHAVMTSADAVSWTLQATPSFLGQCIVWNPTLGLFVAGAVGNGTQNIMTSSDGLTWTVRTTPLDHSVYDLASIDSRLCSANRSETAVIRSLDAITWTSSITDLPWGLGDIDSDGASFIAVSVFGVGKSEDFGVTWATMIVPSPDWEGLCYVSALGLWVATSGTGGVAGHRAMFMLNGGAWGHANTPAAADGGNWRSVAASGVSTASQQCLYPVASIITDLSERVGLPASLIDVSDIPEDCRGFLVVNQYPCFTALRSLSEIFLFDPSSRDGKVHFISRGGNTVATVTEDDMLDDEKDIEQSRRGDAIAIPRVLNLNYHDVAGGIATDKQTSERAGDRRSTGEVSLQTAVLLNANEAARVAAINHKIMIEDQRGELRFCLPDSFVYLTPADNVILQWQGRSIRARITKADTDDGYQEYLGLHDRQSAYTSNIEGIPAAPQTPPPSSVVGPTLIQLLDIHILRDVDDNIGLSYYVAISGVLDAWQGALVELSLDGGENYIDSASTRISAVMGEIITVLDDHPAEFPDETHSVTVRIDTPLAELVETDLIGMLNGANLAIIGDELIQFANANELVPGTWQLSLLLRGRKGSGSASHAIGTRFVLLDIATLNVVPASLADIGRTLTFRATSFGMPVETGTVVSVTYTGRSQIEREPGYVMAHRDGTDAVVSWQGVGRLGSGVAVAQGARFAGYRVIFDDGAIQQVVDTADQDLTHDVSALASPISISVSQLNDLTGAGPSIEVILT